MDLHLPTRIGQITRLSPYRLSSSSSTVTMQLFPYGMPYYFQCWFINHANSAWEVLYFVLNSPKVVMFGAPYENCFEKTSSIICCRATLAGAQRCTTYKISLRRKKSWISHQKISAHLMCVLVGKSRSLLHGAMSGYYWLGRLQTLRKEEIIRLEMVSTALVSY